MIVALDVDQLRAWHLRLLDHIEEAGHDAFLRHVGRAAGSGRASLVLGLERRLYRAVSQAFVAVADAPASPSRPCDLVIAAGTVGTYEDGPVLDILFDGVVGEAALVDTLLRGQLPTVTARLRGTSRDLARGLPAVEDPSILARALDPVLERTSTLVLQALRHLDAGTASEQGISQPGTAAAGRVSVSRFLLRGVVGKLLWRYGPARGRPDPWCVAYRAVRGAPGAEPWDTGFIELASDRRRFHADPFPFEDQGRRFVFFEDYPYPSRKGIIAVVEIDATGRPTAPRIVLEQPCHLSYPFVFRHDDAIFMMPEMSGAGRIQLFRAETLPDVWQPDRVLVPDIAASDPTMIRFGGLWWIFATVAGARGSSWDQLCLFHAPELFGPWTAHKANPVLIDAGSARPAGAMWIENGRLMRVAQDSRKRYGDGLVICHVDRLDPEGYHQTIERRIEAPRGSDADGVHTLSRSETLEAIDLRHRGVGRGFSLSSLFGSSSRTGA
jgi:hypothetical protein